MEGFSITVFGGGILAGLIVALVIFLLARPAARRRADQRYRERADELIALFSHYLLTPISIIQEALSHLQDEDNNLDPKDRRKMYDTIFQGQQRLWILAERFVIAGELQNAEGLKLNMKVTDLSKLITDCITAVDSFARAKSVTIHYQEPLGAASWETRLDQRRMKQSFIAVLDNAVKFSGEGGQVQVALNCENNQFQVKITDSGIGMPKEIIDNLGQPLSRGTSMYNFDYEGIGLGLYIAKEVVAAQSGVMRIESHPKRGTVVTIEFPNQ